MQGYIERVKEIFPKLKAFNAFYENNAKHESGLFYFFDDFLTVKIPETLCRSNAVKTVIFKQSFFCRRYRKFNIISIFFFSQKYTGKPKTVTAKYLGYFIPSDAAKIQIKP